MQEKLRLQSRIPSLDGLRAISILFVLYGHAVGTAGFPVATHNLGLAEAGVRIFFIISGFLITTLLLKELNASGRICLKGFYRRRILRIFPAFYAYWLIGLALVLAGWLAVPGKDLLYAATYTINYVADRPWYLGHLWSLAVEEQFYAVWPLTLFVLGQRRGFWVVAAVLVLTPPLRVAQFHLFPSHRLGIDEEFHTIGDCIATGCLLAGLQGWLWTHDRYRSFLSSWQFWVAPALIVVAMVISVHPQVKWLLGIPLFNLAVAVCIDRWTRFPQADAVAIFFNWKPVAFLGVLSYSLYLWQQPFINRYGYHLWNRFPLNVILAFIVALGSYFLIEKPFLAMRHKSPPQYGGAASLHAPIQPVTGGTP